MTDRIDGPLQLRIKAALKRRPLDATAWDHDRTICRLAGSLMGIIDNPRTPPEVAERLALAFERAVDAGLTNAEREEIQA